MDFGIIDGLKPADPSPGVPPYESFEAARYAMGDTLRYAQKMNLMQMEPRGDLSSTGYVLAQPGEEYLILQTAEKADPFSVTLAAGAYKVQWYSLNSRETARAGRINIANPTSISFSAPFEAAGPAVLYLKKA